MEGSFARPTAFQSTGTRKGNAGANAANRKKARECDRLLRERFGSAREIPRGLIFLGETVDAGFVAYPLSFKAFDPAGVDLFGGDCAADLGKTEDVDRVTVKMYEV